MTTAAPTPTHLKDLDRSVAWGEVAVSLFSSGDRRLEAHTYLADGYGLRKRIETKDGISVPLSTLARVWQPSRLKGYVVPAGKGLPFLSAGQVFEARPRVRKWIATAMVRDAVLRQVEKEWLLLSCSGEVGKLTAVYDEHLHKVITHDLLRIVPHNASDYGWLYAYMRTPTFYSIARSAQYGHMIKHLEAAHVLTMPVVMPDLSTRALIGHKASRALELRQESRRTQIAADAEYARLINPTGLPVAQEVFQEVNATELMFGRRRFEGQYFRSDFRIIESLIRAAATRGVDTVGSATKSVTLGNRFKRYFGENGTPYRSAGELFDVNAPVTKRIYSALLDDPERYMLQPGHLVMARSGQTYGLLGRTMILNEQHRGVFGSDDFIRIEPDPQKIRIGYLQTALAHETYGRPLAIRHASGTSIPHLDPVDIREVPIPRFDPSDEGRIADLCESASQMSAEADAMETEAIAEAESAIEEMTGVHAVSSLDE
ncbi:hypothetical protein MT994_17370 [Cellulosimicrobium sp. MI9406]|uniref:hypothetical protein n=1 Tax=Cellulosimicrobium sp. MI9406 TaxID=2931398 RepID=UPI0033BFA8B6